MRFLGFFLLLQNLHNTSSISIKKIYHPRNLKIYVLVGIGHKTTTRNTNKFLGEIHQYYSKKDYINIMSGQAKIANEAVFSYTYDIPNGPNEPKSYNMSNDQFAFMYESYARILAETSMDNRGNITFKIKTFTNDNNTFIIESASYISWISTLFSFFSGASNAEEKKQSETILWINNIHGSLWKRGIHHYTGHKATNNSQSDVFTTIDDKRIVRGPCALLKKVNDLLSSNTPKEHKSFVLSLMPIYDVTKRKWFFSNNNNKNYYLIDRDLYYYEIEEQHLDFNNNIPATKKIKRIGKIKDLKELAQAAPKVEDPKVAHITYKEYLALMDKRIFSGNNPVTNNLTFLMLQIQKNPSTSIMDFQKLLEEIHDNKNDNKNIYEFNMDNVDSSLFFLFGYGNKMEPNALPYDYYIKNLETLESESKETKEKEKLKDNEKYNFPHYTRKEENITLLSNAMLALPQTEPCHVNQWGLILSLLFLQDNWCVLSTLEYMPITNNVSLNRPMRQTTNELYYSVLAGYRILENVYLGPSFTLMNRKYFLHKYFDTSWGIGLTSTIFPLVTTIYYQYDIAHNTLIFTLNVQLAKQIYGNVDPLEEEGESAYVEFL